MSSNFYVACEFGEQSGRVWLGTLHRDGLTMSEVRGFQTRPTEDKGVLVWEVPRLCQEILTALRGIALHEEPVESVSCHSWSADSLLLAADGSLITPVYHHQDGRTQAGMNNVAAKLPWETLYDETGVQPSPANSIYQLAAEKSRRLERAAHFLPLADAFNFLLGGAPRFGGFTRQPDAALQSREARLVGAGDRSVAPAGENIPASGAGGNGTRRVETRNHQGNRTDRHARHCLVFARSGRHGGGPADGAR